MRIALVAHDDKKNDMVAFAEKHRAGLQRLHAVRNGHHRRKGDGALPNSG